MSTLVSKINKKSKSIMSMVVLIAVISGALLLSACSGKTNQDVINEEGAVVSIVESFGSKLQTVPLLDSKDIVEKSMQENYGNLVSQALIEEWIGDPLNAPGRRISSPWPDRIEILSTEKLSEDTYEVKGKIIEITSTEKVNGGVAAKRPITLAVKKIENRWLIDDVMLGAYDVTLEQPPKQSATANLSDIEILEVANKWAETWRSRDGKTRYELMSSKMQKVFYEQQMENNGKEGVWVIRWSSPWVESYDIHIDGEQAVITYWYSDSTSAKYEGVELLFLSKENGKALVINAVMEKEMDKVTSE
jgi:hypothetical protein